MCQVKVGSPHFGHLPGPAGSYESRNSLTLSLMESPTNSYERSLACGVFISEDMSEPQESLMLPCGVLVGAKILRPHLPGMPQCSLIMIVIHSTQKKETPRFYKMIF